MHRSRTTLTVLALCAAVAGCGARSASPSGSVGAQGAGATTPASHPKTTSAAAKSATVTSTKPTSLSATPATPATASAVPTSSADPTTSADPTSTGVATSPSSTPTGTATGTPTGQPSVDATVTIADPSVRPHFDTPEAAMRYLAAAWNSYDETALKHVTQGQARLLLLGMRGQAVNLRLNHCELRSGGNGDYLCHFDHDYPASYPAKLREGSHGTAEFIAAPSASVGWYMFAYEGCG